MPHRIDGQSPALTFQRTLLSLSDEHKFLLQIIHDLRALTQLDLSRYFYAGASQKLHIRLRDLEMCGLISFLDEFWQPTWAGDGTANWRQQMLGAEGLELAAIPLPRAGENGQLLGPPCGEYRAAFFAPGYCWCCRPRFGHMDEYLKAAEQILKQTGV